MWIAITLGIVGFTLIGINFVLTVYRHNAKSERARTGKSDPMTGSYS